MTKLVQEITKDMEAMIEKVTEHRNRAEAELQWDLVTHMNGLLQELEYRKQELWNDFE